MIRFKDKVFEEYYINQITAEITDEQGVIQKTYIVPTDAYMRFKGMQVHRIQAHTAWGYKEGYDVHHKDGNIFNNSLENLDYISHAEHAKITHTGKQRHFSEEQYRQWIKRLSDSHKGHVPVNKGVKGVYKMSEETRRKMSEIRKGHPGYTKGSLWWNNGKECHRFKECPGDGWVRGRLKK